MKKALEFRFAPHTIRTGAQVLELWYDGRFVGQITAAPDTPTLRIISKHGFAVEVAEGLPGEVPVVQVALKL